MGREVQNTEMPVSQLTSFSPDADRFAIISGDSTIKVCPVSFSLGHVHRVTLGEWKDPDREAHATYSCILCGFVGKKRRKEGKTVLVILGTTVGDVVAIDVLSEGRKWTNSQCHPGGTTCLIFSDKGRTVFTSGADGMVHQLNTETGELVETFKASKRAICSLASSCDEKFLASASDRVRLFILPDKKEILKFSSDLGLPQCIALSDDGKNVVSSFIAEKQLQVWSSNEDHRSINVKVVLPMQSSPVMLECRSNEEVGIVVLSVSEKGVAYLWVLKDGTQGEVLPTRILVKTDNTKMGQQKSIRKKHARVVAAKLCNSGSKQVSCYVAYGPLANLKFEKVEVTKFGEDICLPIDDESSVGKGRSGLQEVQTIGEDGMDVKGGQFDMNEPTMSEKLASLDLHDNGKPDHANGDAPLAFKLPAADSVHVLLKQALHADDHALLLDCLYTRDEKVIAKSIALLNPADALKLLNALISLTQSRGAVLVCAIPWLKHLLSQHTSSIVSQESSLNVLNTLFQLIESRVSTYGSALELSTCLDYFLAGVLDNEDDAETTAPPLVYEDKDTDEDESGDAMETDEGSEGVIAGDSPHGSDGSEVMSD